MSVLLPPSEEMDTARAGLLQLAAREQGDLLTWAIYNSPDDHPGKFVARPFSAKRNAPLLHHLIADDLDTLRTMLPSGLIRMVRHPDDDAAIVESWI